MTAPGDLLPARVSRGRSCGGLGGETHASVSPALSRISRQGALSPVLATTRESAEQRGGVVCDAHSSRPVGVQIGPQLEPAWRFRNDKTEGQCSDAFAVAPAKCAAATRHAGYSSRARDRARRGPGVTVLSV